MFIDNLDMLDECPKVGTLSYTVIQYIWVCKDGTEIPLSEMTTSHLNNCVAMIKRSVKFNKTWRVDALPYLYEELSKRKDYFCNSKKLKVL